MLCVCLCLCRERLRIDEGTEHKYFPTYFIHLLDKSAAAKRQFKTFHMNNPYVLGDTLVIQQHGYLIDINLCTA